MNSLSFPNPARALNCTALHCSALVLFLVLSITARGEQQVAATIADGREKMLGMYVHQHWAYRHPYAARTWTLSDWKGYLDGINRLGYNTVFIWPVLETMPDPLTASDLENLNKIAAVTDFAHQQLGMRVYVILCPNVSPKSSIASQYTFAGRPFFQTDDRVDPGDPVAFGRLMEWREKLFRPLAAVDGLVIIDSDPGGYPGSTLLEFVYLLGAHRRMLDRVRPGIELVYWAAHGWESYGRFYATADIKHLGRNTDESRATISLIAQQSYEPWIVASARGPDLADSIGFRHKVVAFNYGAIEYEPAFPITLYGLERTLKGGRDAGPLGVVGNSQTHCVQLPNAFAFARAARGLSVAREDYVTFANDLLPGNGDAIVKGWETLQGSDSGAMRAAADRLQLLAAGNPDTGALRGLLFGEPRRFLDDLVLQLRAAAALHDFHRAVHADARNQARVTASFRAFLDAIEPWQQKHGYSNHWRWPPLQEALVKLDHPIVNETLRTLSWVSEEGPTPFDRVKMGLARLETYTPRLLTAMRKALAEMEAGLPREATATRLPAQ